MKPDTTGWTCGHCGLSFKKVNATKALAHVLCKNGFSIAGCKAYIDPSDKKRYEDLLLKKESASETRGKKKEVLSNNITNVQARAVEVIEIGGGEGKCMFSDIHNICNALFKLD